jgi:DNA polymerase (family 10)
VTLDLEEVFKAVARTNTVLEINAMPSRLDLKDIHAYRARELGVMLAINTDAHSTKQLQFIRFGVGTARRGWCQATDIINTRPLGELGAYLKSRSKRGNDSP